MYIYIYIHKHTYTHTNGRRLLGIYHESIYMYIYIYTNIHIYIHTHKLHTHRRFLGIDDESLNAKQCLKHAQLVHFGGAKRAEANELFRDARYSRFLVVADQVLRMYVCVCVYIYIYILRIHIYIHAYIHTYTCTRRYPNSDTMAILLYTTPQMHTCIHTYTYAYIHRSVFMWVYIHVRCRLWRL